MQHVGWLFLTTPTSAESMANIGFSLPQWQHLSPPRASAGASFNLVAHHHDRFSIVLPGLNEFFLVLRQKSACTSVMPHLCGHAFGISSLSPVSITGVICIRFQTIYWFFGFFLYFIALRHDAVHFIVHNQITYGVSFLG